MNVAPLGGGRGGGGYTHIDYRCSLPVLHCSLISVCLDYTKLLRQLSGAAAVSILLLSILNANYIV